MCGAWSIKPPTGGGFGQVQRSLLPAEREIQQRRIQRHDRHHDAIKAGATISFHSDSPVAPVNPLLDVQCMVTRWPVIGGLVGADQTISVDDAFRAHVVNAAHHLRREDSLDSFSVGKVADSLELSADPYAVDVGQLTEHVKVFRAWSSGHKIDIASFISDVKQIGPREHPDLAHEAVQSRRSLRAAVTEVATARGGRIGSPACAPISR
jgi:hypothetical protein